MNREDQAPYKNSPSDAYEPSQAKHNPSENKNSDTDSDAPYTPPAGEILKIADIQRMNIDELNQFGRKSV